MILSKSDTDIVRGVRRTDRLATCWSAMETIIGEPLPVKDRHIDKFTARALVFLRMKLDGYSINGTAKAIGKNHATVLNACRAAEFYLRHPRLYPDVAEAWKKLNEIVGQI